MFVKAAVAKQGQFSASKMSRGKDQKENNKARNEAKYIMLNKIVPCDIFISYLLLFIIIVEGKILEKYKNLNDDMASKCSPALFKHL